MSYEDGWAAMNLEMSERIPRTEYSVEKHWELIEEVTGIRIGVDSSEAEQEAASIAFMEAWNYDFFWQTLIGKEEFGELQTDMGHAEYEIGGVDRRDSMQCPFKDPEEALALDPWEAYGERDLGELSRRFESHYQANSSRHDFGVNMTGIYTTLMSGLIGVLGWDMLLMAAGTDLKRFGELANRYARWMQQYFDALAEADVPVVMVHDDIVWASGPFIRPEWYRQYVFPNYRKYFAPLLESGKKVIFCSDGDFDEFVDEIVRTGVHGLVFEPLTSLEHVVERYGRELVIVGNADTRALMSGDERWIRSEVERCIGLGKGCPGYFMAVGNHIPPTTPVESVMYYNEVYKELCQR